MYASCTCTQQTQQTATRHAWLPAHSFSHRPATSRWCPTLLPQALGVRPICFSCKAQAHSRALLLQVLFASTACRMSSFGAARGIRHLMLEMPNPQCGRISSAVSELDQLETLWLKDVAGGATGVQPKTYGALQLSNFPSLRSLKLIGVVPDSISCSDSCELHVGLAVGWSMEHPVWDTVLSRLRSVYLYGWRSPLVALPSILLKAGNVTSATVMVNQCGTADAPLLLGGSLAHVEELVMHCLEVHAIMPARVTWRDVYVAATHLNLRFKAVESFGEAIPAFCFRFKEVQVCSPEPSPCLSWPSQPLLLNPLFAPGFSTL